MKRAIYIILLLTLIAVSQEAGAQKKAKRGKTVDEPPYSNEYLDTVNVKKAFVLNDYTLIGVEYGVSYNRMTFNPKFQQESILYPEYYGVTLTRYGKMFGYLSYFGFQIGAFYGWEGYQFKADEDTGYITRINGATRVNMKIVEVPFTAQFHYDMPNFKILADAGIYGGYRLSKERVGPLVVRGTEYDWADEDHRWDYGLHFSTGFGAVVSPLEFHVKLRFRYSWSSLFDPDYNSKYYYRYAYPFDFMLTFGVHYQLTRRTGKTKADLRREARKIVFSEVEE